MPVAPLRVNGRAHLLLFGFELCLGNGFSGTGLRMSIVGWSAGALLRVFALPPLGTSVLKPYLKWDGKTGLNQFNCPRKKVSRAKVGSRRRRTGRGEYINTGLWR